MALVLFAAMPLAEILPDVISYNAAISACEKGGQWQHALTLLSNLQEIWEVSWICFLSESQVSTSQVGRESIEHLCLLLRVVCA